MPSAQTKPEAVTMKTKHGSLVFNWRCSWREIGRYCKMMDFVLQYAAFRTSHGGLVSPQSSLNIASLALASLSCRRSRSFATGFRELFYLVVFFSGFFHFFAVLLLALYSLILCLDSCEGPEYIVVWLMRFRLRLSVRPAIGISCLCVRTYVGGICFSL